MLKIAICDDEKLFCNQLKDMIEQYMDDQEIVYKIEQYSSGNDFISLGVKIVEYRILFLDINMSGLNGIETAIKIRSLCKDLIIVFITAYMNCVLDGYKVNAFRYLLKNTDNFDVAFEECMDSVMKTMQMKPKKIDFDFMDGKRNICTSRIMYIESSLHKVIFHIYKNEMAQYVINKETLNRIEQRISDVSFIRIHQSYLVNVSFVQEINQQMVVLADGTALPVSRSKYKNVMEQITIYKGTF